MPEAEATLLHMSDRSGNTRCSAEDLFKSFLVQTAPPPPPPAEARHARRSLPMSDPVADEAADTAKPNPASPGSRLTREDLQSLAQAEMPVALCRRVGIWQIRTGWNRSGGKECRAVDGEAAPAAGGHASCNSAT